jgi:hypothetical protein
MEDKWPEEISIPVWTGHGTGLLRRRSGLPPEHPESEYRYVKEHYPNVDPHDYGIDLPRDRCDKCGHLLEDT